MPLKIITACCFCFLMACEVNKPGIKTEGPRWTQSYYLTLNIQGVVFILSISLTCNDLSVSLSPLPINHSIYLSFLLGKGDYEGDYG